MDRNINWDEVYKDFPINQKYIWLNNCGTTSASRYVEEGMAVFFREYARHGIYGREYAYMDVKNGIQKILGELLNTEPANIALVHNTSEAMNLVSYGLSLEAGDEILILEDEYPSNVYPWEHWTGEGIQLFTVPMASTPEAFLDNLKHAISSRTRVAALSTVHWCTGMPLPVEQIARLCRERDIFLVLDGAQGVGHVHLDVSGWGLPVLGFSAWKWLLGPLGLACLVIPQNELDRIKPVFKGTDSVVGSLEYLPYKEELKPTAERYIYSTANFADWVYFYISLKYLHSLGFGNVMARIYELAGCLGDLLRKKGFTILSDGFGNGSPSGIVVAEKEGLDAALAVKDLEAHGIIARERKGRIRLAPHIYNSLEQLEKTADLVER